MESALHQRANAVMGAFNCVVKSVAREVRHRDEQCERLANKVLAVLNRKEVAIVDEPTTEVVRWDWFPVSSTEFVRVPLHAPEPGSPYEFLLNSDDFFLFS